MKTFELESPDSLSTLVLDKIYEVRLQDNVVTVGYEVRNITFTYIDDETAETIYEELIKAIEENK